MGVTECCRLILLFLYSGLRWWYAMGNHPHPLPLSSLRRKSTLGMLFFNMGGANGIPPSTPTYHLGDRKGSGRNDCALADIEDQGFLRFPFPPSPMSGDHRQSSDPDFPPVAKVDDVEDSTNES